MFLLLLIQETKEPEESTRGPEKSTRGPEKSTRGQADDNTLKVVLAVVGSILGVALVACMFVALYFCKWKRRGKSYFQGV